jgi:signal peptidase I
VQPEPSIKRGPSLSARSVLWRDVVEIALLIAVIYTFVNLATARAVVEGASMRPNFDTGQLVIVNRFAYFFNPPQRGDVIVLHNPRNVSEDFIKRVIGLPNETVEIKEGRVSVNGTPLDEPYITKFCTVGCDGAWTLKDDEYFVLGDNRSSSHDSHAFGPIQRSLIVGQAWIRYWPLPEFQIIQHPRYPPVRTDYTPPPPPPTYTPAPYTPGAPQLPGGPNPYEGAQLRKTPMNQVQGVK